MYVSVFPYVAAIQCKYRTNRKSNKEALVRGHPRDGKNVSITGAGCLLECKNTEIVWELRKTEFCEGDRK